MEERQRELQEKLEELKRYEEDKRVQLIVSEKLKLLCYFYRN
jgi:hypothetical protein